MIKRIIALCIIISMIPFSALTNTYAEPEVIDMTVKLYPNQASTFNNGEFQGWGTSLCWWANYLGQYDELAQKSAKLMFNPEEGLGLNIARYNIGGGDDPTHTHITRPDSNMPGFLNPDGSYDWTADANQRLVLDYAIKEGVDIVEAFSNSPPYFMTNSGCSSGSWDAISNNLRDDQYEAFAEYLAEVALHFKEEWGITFDSLEPLNEPAADSWVAHNFKQEGCHFDQGEAQSRIITELGKSITKRGLTDTIIAAGDEVSIDDAIRGYNLLSDDAKTLVKRINTHTYGGSQRVELKNLAEANGKNLWMSETDWHGTEGTNAGYMAPALWLGKRITDDVNGMQPSAWVLWQVIDRHISDETPDATMPSSDGYWGTAIANHYTKEIHLTKKYYAFGQYSRYIRPGYTIIASSDNTLAAYDKKTGKIVVVALNLNGDNKNCKFDLTDFANVGSRVRVIRTSGDLETGENWAELEDLKTSNKAFTADLLANSITTFVVEPDLNKYELEFTNENGIKLSADNLEYITSDSVIIKNSADNTVLKNNITFGEYTDSDVWTLRSYENYCYIENSNGDKLTVDANGNLSFSTDSAKWTITPKLNILYMTLKNSGIALTGRDIQMELDSVPENIDTSSLIWTVTEPDGSVTDKATINSSGVLTGIKNGRVKVTATAKYDPTLFTTTELVIFKDTDYVIFTNKNSGKIIDLANRSTEDGIPTVQWDNIQFSSSQWKLKPVEGANGYFNLINRKSNTMLVNVDGHTILNSTMAYSDESSQWHIEEYSQGYYKIINRATGMGLNVAEQSTVNGTIVMQYPFSGANNELWAINRVESEPVDLENNLNKIAIDKNLVTGTTPWNNSGDTAQNAADGNYDTFFDGLTDGWVQIDLGKVVDVSAIGYIPRGGFEFRMKDGMFYGSIDGDSWTKFYTVKDIPANSLNLVSANNFDADSNKYRYIKYIVPSGGHNYAQDGRYEAYCCNIAEIEVYGDYTEGVTGNNIAIYNGTEKLETFPEEGGKYNVKTAYMNNSTDKVELYYIITVKCNNNLIDMMVIPKTFEANEQHTFDDELTIPASSDGSKIEIKAMLWDDIKEYTPYSLPISINK